MCLENVPQQLTTKIKYEGKVMFIPEVCESGTGERVYFLMITMLLRLRIMECLNTEKERLCFW